MLDRQLWTTDEEPVTESPRPLFNIGLDNPPAILTSLIDCFKQVVVFAGVELFRFEEAIPTDWVTFVR